ncbi:unnamed protein product [Rhizoctonia solani]|uniref:Epoxide hydrolase N-terminal domain-containing protein n=1 Tax=Rhizoctonia solani TaxID=456999 RepID=A0A8H3A394_9AGAM|nr:unnamed protein product [Rhizoctonia solani]
MATHTDIRPFKIAVPDSQLQEIRAKLDLTRLPDELELPIGQEWEWGIPLAVLKPTIEYWRTKYDWRKVEEHINQTLPQFTTYVDSANHGQQEVHFVHKKSNNPNATPLIFVHGWPGNFLEVSKMIDELANPTDPKHPAFHVVAPSLPGGYSKEEMEGLKTMDEFQTTGSGYARIQGSRPQTLAVAMTDSPAGLLAWIGEKLYAWTDSYPWTADELITWTMLYWVNGPAGGFRYYKENPFMGTSQDPTAIAELKHLNSTWSPTPLGFSSFPKELARFPLEWNGVNQNLVYGKEHTKGGHFAAWEVPDLLLEDIRGFAQVVLPKEQRLRAH